MKNKIKCKHQSLASPHRQYASKFCPQCGTQLLFGKNEKIATELLAKPRAVISFLPKDREKFYKAVEVAWQEYWGDCDGGDGIEADFKGYGVLTMYLFTHGKKAFIDMEHADIEFLGPDELH